MGQVKKGYQISLSVITLDQPDARPAICDELFREYPEGRVIAVAQHKNSVVYYWTSLNIRSSDIESSKEGILNAMRSRMGGE